jgi:hypothetical protein
VRGLFFFSFLFTNVFSLDSLMTIGRRALQDFTDSVQTDPQKKHAPDGTVHELTSNTMKVSYRHHVQVRLS